MTTSRSDEKPGGGGSGDGGGELSATTRIGINYGRGGNPGGGDPPILLLPISSTAPLRSNSGSSPY